MREKTPSPWQYVRDREAEIERLRATIRGLEADPTPWNLRIAKSMRVQIDIASLAAATYALERS